MKRIIAFIVVLTMSEPTSPAEPPGNADRFNAIHRGMAVDDVKRLLGRPNHVTREVLFRRYIEEWHYDEPAGLVEFNCVRGEPGYVLGVYVDSPRR